MPYVFPYEDLFVYITAALIVGLLFFRVRMARRRKANLKQETVRLEDGNGTSLPKKDSALY